MQASRFILNARNDLGYGALIKYEKGCEVWGLSYLSGGIVNIEDVSSKESVNVEICDYCYLGLKRKINNNFMKKYEFSQKK